MQARDRFLAGSLAIALVLSVVGGFDQGGWSAIDAAQIFTSLALGIGVVVHYLGVRLRADALALARSQGSANSRSSTRVSRSVGAPERIGERQLGQIDPRLFLRPENSLGDDAIVLILKNYGAQIWGVSLYWHHLERTHFIDQTHPTLETGEEIIAFVQRAELPAEFDVIVSYTRRDGRELEERWSILMQDGAFDCTYGGQVTGGVVSSAH